MTHVCDGLTKAFPTTPWLFQPATPDVVAVLSEALGTDWAVERETDCEGEVSIIALSTIAVEGAPSLILFENDGQTCVATMNGDDLGWKRRFSGFQQAIDAFIAAARAAAIGVCAQSDGCAGSAPGQSIEPTSRQQRHPVAAHRPTSNSGCADTPGAPGPP
jgi:hypothetical protein